ARTLGGTPRTYYYRCLEDDTTWTPWVPMPVDIRSLDTGPNLMQGDIPDVSGVQLLPVVRNRRLHAFWLVIDQKVDQSLPTTGMTIDPTKPIVIQKPDTSTEVTLAWSVYENGKWTPKQYSAFPLHSNWEHLSAIKLKAEEQDGDVILWVEFEG